MEIGIVTDPSGKPIFLTVSNQVKKQPTPEELAAERAGANIKLSAMYRPGSIETVVVCTNCDLCLERQAKAAEELK